MSEGKTWVIKEMILRLLGSHLEKNLSWIPTSLLTLNKFQLDQRFNHKK